MFLLQNDSNWQETKDNWNDMMAEWQPLFDVIASPLGVLFSLAFITVCSVLLLGIVVVLWRDKAEAAP